MSRLGGRRGLKSGGRLKPGSEPLTSRPDGEGLVFEEEVAALYAALTGKRARRQRGSGAQWFRPGDVLTPEFLIECKQRAHPVIKRVWLEKNAEEAKAYSGRVPVLIFRHNRPAGRTWLIIDRQLLPESIPVPAVCVSGGRTQATVQPADLERFILAFRDDDRTYVALPPEEIFTRLELFRR